MSLDEALAALEAALAAADVPGWDAPASHADLEELEKEIAPLRLPPVVRDFWRRVDVGTLRATPYPRFNTPAFALRSWRMARDEFSADQPLALLDVGYESHACMSVELDVGDVDGGALFEWFISDPDGFDRSFNSLPEWLAHVADVIARGLYRRMDTERGPYLLVPDPDREGDERAMRPTPGPHPIHGTSLHVDRDIIEWPEHWQRANGVGPEHTSLRGATHTIAEVNASPSSQELRATVAARVVDLAGSSSWTRVRVDDGTGELDVHCPPDTTLMGPRLGDWYEIDVIVPAGERHVPTDPEAASAGIEDDVDRLVAVWTARYGGPVGATARAIRRLDRD